MKEEKQTCKHMFKYSHQEEVWNYAQTDTVKIDVVLCEKCGLIKRTNK